MQNHDQMQFKYIALVAVIISQFFIVNFLIVNFWLCRLFILSFKVWYALSCLWGYPTTSIKDLVKKYSSHVGTKPEFLPIMSRLLYRANCKLYWPVNRKVYTFLHQHVKFLNWVLKCCIYFLRFIFHKILLIN